MIRTKDGKEFVLGDYDVIVKDFNVSSIQLEPTYAKIEGADGSVDMGATAESRTITLPITMRANDLLDYPLLRDVIFDLMVNKESFYIHEMRRPKQMAYEFVDTNEAPKDNAESDNVVVTGKRYLVRLSNQFEFDQLNVYGDAELTFETTELPYAESIKTSMDIHTNGLRYGDGWSYGMGLLYDEESHVYEYNATSFRIYNPSDITVKPFEHDLKVTLTGIVGTGFEMKNLTTNETFKINDAMATGDTFIIDGANMTFNNAQGLRKTNRKYVSLAKGWNEITLNKQAKTTFNYRFYYK